VIPPEAFETKRPHVAILNDVAWSIVESQRGKHPIWVLPCVAALLAGLVCYGLVGKSRFAVVYATSSSAAVLLSVTHSIAPNNGVLQLAVLRKYSDGRYSSASCQPLTLSLALRQASTHGANRPTPISR
jgi:hypothetical protein